METRLAKGSSRYEKPNDTEKILKLDDSRLYCPTQPVKASRELATQLDSHTLEAAHPLLLL